MRIVPPPRVRRLDSPHPQGLPRIAQHGQPALSQNIELHQTHRLDRIHIELRRRPSARTGEERRQCVHRLPRNHHATRMHLRVTRKTIQPRRQLQRRLIRILLPNQTPRLHALLRRRRHLTRRGLR